MKIHEHGTDVLVLEVYHSGRDASTTHTLSMVTQANAICVNRSHVVKMGAVPSTGPPSDLPPLSPSPPPQTLLGNASALLSHFLCMPP